MKESASTHWHPLKSGDIADSLDFYLARHSRSHKAIVAVILLIPLLLMMFVPWVKVDVAITRGGIVRPVSDKVEVRSPLSGVVGQSEVLDNQRVEHGSVIVVLQGMDHKQRLSAVELELRETKNALADLRRLTTLSSEEPSSTPFASAEYRQQFAEYVDEVAGLRARGRIAEADLARQQSLYRLRASTMGELERAQLAMSENRMQLTTLRNRRLSQWQTEFTAARLRLARLTSDLKHLQDEGEQYVLRAPIGGTLEQQANLSPGSYLRSGESIALISPDTTLIVEVQTSPGDIGLLWRGMPVRIHVDAFNYLEWGAVDGTLLDISQDYVLVDGRPMFRVLCSLSRLKLSLRSGVVGRLQKGMSAQVRFLIARRTLAQLLRDGVNDWLNPSVSRDSRLSWATPGMH